MNEEYQQKLKNILWYKKAEIIRERDKMRCTKCGSDHLIQVHHKYYVHHREPWDYPDSALTTLCFLCHKEAHSGREKIKMYIPGSKDLLEIEMPDWYRKQKEENLKKIQDHMLRIQSRESKHVEDDQTEPDFPKWHWIFFPIALPFFLLKAMSPIFLVLIGSFFAGYLVYQIFSFLSFPDPLSMFFVVTVVIFSFIKLCNFIKEK